MRVSTTSENSLLRELYRLLDKNYSQSKRLHPGVPHFFRFAKINIWMLSQATSLYLIANMFVYY